MRGLSPPIFQGGGARAPPAPPISPPMERHLHYTLAHGYGQYTCTRP